MNSPGTWEGCARKRHCTIPLRRGSMTRYSARMRGGGGAMEIETRLLEEWKANCEGRSGRFLDGFPDGPRSNSDSTAYHFFLLYAC